MSVLTILAAVLLVLCIADAITTYIVLQYPNTREANPIFKKVIDVMGLVPALTAKTVLSAAFALYVIFSDLGFIVSNLSNNFVFTSLFVVLVLLITLYAWVVYSNTSVIIFLKKKFKY